MDTPESGQLRNTALVIDAAASFPLLIGAHIATYGKQLPELLDAVSHVPSIVGSGTIAIAAAGVALEKQPVAQYLNPSIETQKEVFWIGALAATLANVAVESQVGSSLLNIVYPSTGDMYDAAYGTAWGFLVSWIFAKEATKPGGLLHKLTILSDRIMNGQGERT